MEADPRHADIIIQQVEFDKCVPLAAPNERMNPQNLSDEDVKELDKDEARLHRAIVVSGNYFNLIYS